MNEFAVSAADVGEGMSKAASVLLTAGASIEESSAMVTGITEVLQDPSTAGTALKILTLRLRGMKGELEDLGEDVDDDVDSISKVLTQLLNMTNGEVNIFDANGNFRDVYDIMSDIAEIFPKLSDTNQASLLETIAGKSRANAVQALISNWDSVQNALVASQNAEGTAAEENLKYMDSLEGRTAAIKALLQDLATLFMSSDFLKGLLDVASELLKLLNSIVGSLGTIGSMATGAGLFAGIKSYKNIKETIGGLTSLDGSLINTLIGLGTGEIAKGSFKSATKTAEDAGESVGKSMLEAVEDKVKSEAVDTGESIVEDIGEGAVEGATSSGVKSISSKIGDVIKGAIKVSPGTVAVAGVATATAVIAGIYTAYKKAQELLAKQASAGAEEWTTNQSSLEESIAQVKEYRELLDSGLLSDQLTVTVKKLIYDIQQQITSQYDEYNGKIDLVNGNLEELLSIIQLISAEDASKNIAENAKAYESAQSLMEKVRNYDLGASSLMTGDLQEILDKYSDYISYNFDAGSGMYTFEIEADAEDANDAITGLMTDLQDLAGDADVTETYFGGIYSAAADALSKNKDVLDTYEESYKSYLLMKLYSSSGNGAETLYNYSSAASDYNDAVASGDIDSVHEAKEALDEATDAKNQFLSYDGNGEFQILFDDITESIDKTTQGQLEFNQALDSDGSKSLTQYQKRLRKFATDIKDSKVKLSDLEDLIIKTKGKGLDNLGSGLQKSFDAIYNRAVAIGQVSGDDIVSGMMSVAETLADAGYIIKDVSSKTIDDAQESFNSFKSYVEGEITNLSTFSTIISDAMGTSGLSATDIIGGEDSEGNEITGLKQLFGDDAYNAIEKTTTGLRVNRVELQKLTAQQQAAEKVKYADSLKDQYDVLRNLTQQLAEQRKAGADTTSLLQSISETQDYIDQLQLLQSEYEGATSKYQAWQDAMSSSNEHDITDSVYSLKSTVDDLISRGWVNQDDVRSYIDYISNVDLAEASVQELMETYQSFSNKISGTSFSIWDFFTVDDDGNSTVDGVYNFLDAINEAFDGAYVQKNEAGDYLIDTLDLDEAIAERLGISMELYQQLMASARDAGFDISFASDETATSLEELKEAASGAYEEIQKMDSLKDIDGFDISGIDLDSTDYDDVSESISKVADACDAVDNSDLGTDDKEKAMKDLAEMSDYLVKNLLELGDNEEFSFAVDLDNVDLIDSLIQDYSAKLDVETDEGEIASIKETISGLISLKQLLQEPAFMSIDASGLSDGLSSLETILQLYLSIESYQLLAQEKASGLDVSTEQIDAAKAKVEEFAQKVNELPESEDIGINLDVDGGVDTIQELLQSVGNSVSVYFEPEGSAVKEYNPDDKSAKVIYTVNKSDVVLFAKDCNSGVYNEDATLTYKATVDQNTLSSVKSAIEAACSVNVTVKGDGTVNGTAHFSGTAHAMGTAHAGGNWSLKHDQPGSLVGELGTEIVVSDGQWRTVGDYGAEFVNLRRGDIVFNHRQSEELLKNGYVTSRGHMIGGSFAYGSAFASSTTGSGFSRATSTAYRSGATSASSSAASSAADAAESASEAASSASDAAESASDASDSTENTLDWIEIKISRIERVIENLARDADSTFNTWAKRNSALAQEIQKTSEEISIQQQAAARYLQEANSVSLSEDYKQKVRDGLIDIETITDSDLNDNISKYQEYYESYLEATDLVDELNESLRELYLTKFDNVQSQFEEITDELQSQNDVIDAQISLIETEGHLVSASYYEDMIGILELILNQQKSELKSLDSALNDGVKNGDIEQFSEAWYEMKESIADVTQAIIESQEAITEYNNNIRQLKWDAFDTLQEQISDTITEAEFLLDLLDAYDLVDEDTGELTANGIATMGAYIAEYNTYMKQSQDYAAELASLDELLASDSDNLDLLDRRQELLEAQLDAISNAEKEKDAIKDLVDEGISAQLDALQELIEKYDDVIDTEKDAYDYQKDIQEKADEISSLNKQISAYSGDNSEENMLRLQQLKNSLKEAQEDLEDTQYDKYVDETESFLDDLYDDYEELVNKRLDDIDALVLTEIDTMSLSTDEIIATITEEAEKVGYTISSALLSSISGISDKPYSGSGLKGYASGSKSVGKSGLFWTNENDSETIVRQSDGAILTKLDVGDMVLNNSARNNFWKMVTEPKTFFDELMDGMSVPETTSQSVQNDVQMNLTIELPNVSDYSSFKQELIKDSLFERFVLEVTFGQLAGHGKLRKYSV